MDGNFYPIYVYFANGNLAPVHFVPQGDGLSLVYYNNVGWGQPGSPVPVYYEIDPNGVSNLVYYQPKLYGQMELRYCTTLPDREMQLFSNPELNRFDGILIQRDGVPKIINDQIRGQALKNNSSFGVPVHRSTNIPEEIMSGLQALQYGKLNGVDIKSNKHGFHLTAEDLDGNRIIIEKHENNGIHRKTVTSVRTEENKSERQVQVAQLRSEGMSQAQIANHLGVSQKTISNDLREINEQGLFRL